MRRLRLIVAIPVVAVATALAGCHAIDKAEARNPGTREAIATTLETTGQTVGSATGAVGGIVGLIGAALGGGLVLLGRRVREDANKPQG